MIATLRTLPQQTDILIYSIYNDRVVRWLYFMVPNPNRTWGLEPMNTLIK